MPYRVVNNRTGVCFVSDDLRRALEAVLANHVRDEHVAAAIEALASAHARADKLHASKWAEALNVTITAV